VQNLSNTVWAFATLQVVDVPFYHMIAAEAICRIHHFSAQPLSNTAWAFASIELLHLPLMRAIAKAAMRGLHKWPTQELVNTVWAVARLQFYHEPLVSALSAAALRRLPEYEARDLSNTSWALAVLAFQDLPLLGRIAEEAVNKLQRGDTQALSNTLWAFATMQMLHEPLIAAIAKEAFRRQDELTAQDISILMWSLATLFVKDEPLIRLLPSCVERRIEDFSPQHLSNTAWAVAILSFADERLMGVFATACIHSIRELDAQNLANTMWAFAKFQLGTAPFLWAMAQRALDGITEFGAQELANTAWSFARLAFLHEPLMDAIACASSQKQRQLSVQDMTNIPWALATLSLHHDQVILFVDAEVVSRPDAFSDDASAPMLVWTMWKAGFHQGLWRLFEYWAEGSLEQVEPYGVFLMDTIWCKDVEGEASVLRRLCSWFPLRCLQMEVALLGEPIAVRRALHPAHQKVAKLVDFLEALVLEGEPAEVLAACEDFAKHKGQWLKVAGGDKADLLHATLQRPLRSGQVVTELGAFVGYSAVRFSSALRRRPGQSSLRLTSLEVNPLHVSVARFLLDMAGLSQVAEVRPGQVKDLVPQLVEELGFHSTGVCFMDHRGTIFHQDFNLLLSHKVLGAEAQLVADNTLNPGAPLFLWERFHGHHHGRVLSTTCWSLTEFLADHEDWTSTSEWRPAPTERQLG